VSSTATIRQTSQAGKKEPTILKEGARVQLVSKSNTDAIELHELGEALIILRKPLREMAWCSSRAQI
jgi:hypothetical protein